MFIAGIGDMTLHALTCREALCLKCHTKPGAEFFGVRKGAPHARTLRIQQNFSLDAICR